MYARLSKMNLSEVFRWLRLPAILETSVPLSSLGAEVRIDIAYGGSCTGASARTWTCMRQSFGAPSTEAKNHPSVDSIFNRVAGGSALRDGSADISRCLRGGATLLEPACGACIGAGPGVSTTSTEVTVSAQNRNYPGEAAPAKCISRALVVAASANGRPDHSVRRALTWDREIDASASTAQRSRAS